MGEAVNGQAVRWSLFTNHARVLIVVARDPAARLRDIAAACDVTERTGWGSGSSLMRGLWAAY
ncbi:hypothetical protein [Streptomyces sp. NPDC048643]|uniref:hypothetical protein n=1 Tax=Streptomyces sp. NPDC048643 TaxID=3155637 RepID=UPI0034142ADF